MSAEARRPEPLNPIADCATLACAPASIELEDANADPDRSHFCGARARRLQRQSGDQSLRTGEPLRERSHLQSLQSLELRAEQRRDRPLKSRTIAIDEPVDTAAVAAHLKATQGLGTIDIPSAYHSNWLDNARAKLDLNWRPRTNLAKLIDAGRAYNRAPTIRGRFCIRAEGRGGLGTVDFQRRVPCRDSIALALGTFRPFHLSSF
jgi:hypothetical protein